jgi:type II secretory ATPase GspE/PulE/Tfp pilus assembly ATPase PilB-like protein
MNWFYVALGVFIVASCPAADIKLTNGQTYQNATVTKNDGKDLEIRYAYQKIRLPLQTVESIDGVPVHAASAAAKPVAKEPSVTPRATPSPALPPAAAQPEESAQPAAEPPYEHRWNMEFLALGFAAFSVLWLVSVTSVQRDLFQRRNSSKLWSNLALALPLVGAVIYYVGMGALDLAHFQKTGTPPRKSKRKKDDAAPLAKRPQLVFLDENNQPISLKKDGALTGIESAQGVLEEALLERASDIHIEPGDIEYRVRFRIDGVMQPRMTYKRSDGMHIVSALKTLAHIDVAEKRKAQDGRFRACNGAEDIDFRVASTHSIFGEKIVIRILNPKMGLLGMNELGMSPAMLDQLVRVIHSRSGMILATGPTGSGKTSTLYSVLSQIDSTRRNIVTIEDPVEYVLSGSTQMPVDVKAGITYESGLRSLLRQDPDVIFVGEMRDIEAAQIALRAALTGHLLFTSLHTKNAIGTIIRLEEMGIERSQLASALLVVLAQRLVRVLCPACRKPVTASGEELREIGIGLPGGETIYQSVGCPKCRGTGYIGRTGIFEMVVFDEELRQAVNSGASEHELTEIAQRKGYRDYRADGIDKLLQGTTSVEEILQAT